MIKSRIFLLIGFVFLNLHAQNHWQVPPEARQLQNPLNDDEAVWQKGQKIFNSLCASCHGQDGTGNPVILKTLNPPPADLTSQTVQQQTDGEIFWKITEGRGLMASYKNMLTEEERWAVVKYIRRLKKNKPKKQTGKITANDNEVEAFSFSQLINAKTTFIRQTGGFGFGIQHRFGATKFDKNMLNNFFGLDLASNIRFSFEIPLTSKLMVDIGRTRYGKFYDLGVKYLLIKQSLDNREPVSIAFYENVAVTTENPPPYSANATFAGGRPFQYQFKHRLYYDTQLIVSRKFSHRFSAQLAAELLWRNLTPGSPAGEKAYVIAVPVSLRYKTGLKSAVDLEIMPNTHRHTFPVSLAYEIASSGNHVFQITVTNSDRILAQNLFFNTTLNYPQDGFMLGFNLIRYF